MADAKKGTEATDRVLAMYDENDRDKDYEIDDLEATGPSRTTVTLTYDWSAVPPQVREYLQFPPFGQDHLDNSLRHLSDLVA